MTKLHQENEEVVNKTQEYRLTFIVGVVRRPQAKNSKNMTTRA